MKKLLLILTILSTTVFSAELDKNKSIITWRAGKITGDFHEGQIFPISSKLKLKKGKLLNGEIIMNLKDFTVTDLEGKWAKKFLTHVKSEDFFNITKHPSAKLLITSTKGNTATGNLTIMGKTQEVSFPLLKFSNKFIGKLSFDRTKFGMIYGSGNYFKNLGDKVVNDIVEVDFEIFIKK